MAKYYNINKMPKKEYCTKCKRFTSKSYGEEEVEDIGDNFVKIVVPIKCNNCQYIDALIWTRTR